MLKSVFNVFRTAPLLGAPVVCLTRVLMLSCILVCYLRIVLAKSLHSKRQGRMPFFGVHVIRSNLAPKYTFFQVDSYNLLFLLGQTQSLCNSCNTCSLFSFQIFLSHTTGFQMPIKVKIRSQHRRDRGFLDLRVCRIGSNALKIEVPAVNLINMMLSGLSD